MKYNVVQQSLEQYLSDSWSSTEIQFDNVAFNADLYTEFLKCHVGFGEGFPRSVTKGCYRQTGVLFLDIHTKPAIGSARKLELAAAAALLVTSVVVSPVSPLVAPKVSFMVPTLSDDNKETNGWVRTIVSCPFYYDLRT